MKDKLEKVYKDEHKKLVGYIRSRVNDPEEAEDLLQDVFYSVLSNFNVLGPIDNLMGYLYAIARNKITDWYRKKRLNTVSLNNKESNHVLEEIIEDISINIEDDYVRAIIEDEIFKNIDNLPKEQKEVFIANEIEGISFKEMSKKMNISINTLLARKRYAVINLRNKLKNFKY